MREKAFTSAGLKSSTTEIWKLQREAHVRQQSLLPSNSPGGSEELEQAQELLYKYMRGFSSAVDFLEELLSQCRIWLKNPIHEPIAVGISSEEDLRFAFDRLKTSFDHKRNELNLLFEMLNSRITEPPPSREKQFKKENVEIEKHQENIRELENKLKTQKEEFELQIKVLKSEDASQPVTACLEEIERLIKERDHFQAQVSSSNQELIRTKSQLEEEFEMASHKYSKEIRTMSTKLKEDTKILETNHIQEVESLVLKHKQRESELLAQIDILSRKEKEHVADLKEDLGLHKQSENNLRMLLSAIHERVSSVYKEFASQTEWLGDLWQRKNDLMLKYGSEEFVEVLIQVDFLTHMVSKMNTDNNWLIEKLAEFKQVNDHLQSRNPFKTPETFHRKVWADIRTTTDALKDFEEARGNLISQFGNKRTSTLR